MSDPRVI